MRFFCRAEFEKADPATSAAADRLEGVLSGMEAEVRAAFADFVREATSDEVMAEVADKLERGDVQGALDVIEPFIQDLGTVMPAIFQDAASAEADSLRTQVARAGSFDPTAPEAADLMRRNALEFVQGLTDSQTAAVREALAVGLETGRPLEATARSFRAAIGLAPGQVNAVANYRRLLSIGSREALDRQLRDMRFDPSVEAAVEGRRPLTPAQIDRMTERYRLNSLANRAVVIARTESNRTLGQAQETALAQTMRRAGIGREDVEQTWHTTMDGRERFTHGAMNEQVRPLGVPFDSPSGAQLAYPCDPSAPAAEVCECRCRRSFRILLSGMTRRGDTRLVA